MVEAVAHGEGRASGRSTHSGAFGFSLAIPQHPRLVIGAPGSGSRVLIVRSPSAAAEGERDPLRLKLTALRAYRPGLPLG